MFDIGFLELLIIMIIALAVIGPERMPEVARKLGAFMGKTKRFINSMKENSELQDTVNELKNSMDLQEEKKRLEDLSQNLDSDLNSFEKASSGETAQIESDNHNFADDFNMDEFERPFGGENTQTNRSQFNKAPQQPKMPEPETQQPQAVEPIQTAQKAEPEKQADAAEIKSTT